MPLIMRETSKQGLLLVTPILLQKEFSSLRGVRGVGVGMAEHTQVLVLP